MSFEVEKSDGPKEDQIVSGYNRKPNSFAQKGIWSNGVIVKLLQFGSFLLFLVQKSRLDRWLGDYAAT